MTINTWIGMKLFRYGKAWCFVLPDFQDLEHSPAVWKNDGLYDQIYDSLLHDACGVDGPVGSNLAKTRKIGNRLAGALKELIRCFEMDNPKLDSLLDEWDQYGGGIDGLGTH